MKQRITLGKRLLSALLTICLMGAVIIAVPPQAQALSASSTSLANYRRDEKPIVDAFRSSYKKTLANSIVGRAIWYMEYGFIVYGHSKYATSGYCDCSQFVSMVYKDFGYSITSASRNYNTVGRAVTGVSCRNGVLYGADKLRPGDIFTFWTTANTGKRHIGHVAIYIGKINGKHRIIGTLKGNPTAIGILSSMSGWYGDHFNSVRRVLPDSAYQTGRTIKDKGPVIPSRYRMTKFTRVIMPRNLTNGF
ncbi:MAG: C40 family peptidase [Syntrophomonadaceae bacterium]|nr:C40 family peptidase [Syntrophomonadaceae bacterium]